MTWEEVCADPSLRGLPYHVETNGRGQVVLSPRHNDASFAKAAVGCLLCGAMPGGELRHTAVIATADGVKTTAAAWMSDDFHAAHKDEAVLASAPEICIEVQSPVSLLGELLEKKDRYLQAGAREVWIREPSGRMQFFDAGGALERSKLCPTFPVTVDV